MEWINIEDMLPVAFEDVLICDNEGDILTGYWHYVNNNKIWTGRDLEQYNITHWMPLPKEPNR